MYNGPFGGAHDASTTVLRRRTNIDGGGRLVAGIMEDNASWVSFSGLTDVWIALCLLLI
jgi:hypothetical protein